MAKTKNNLASAYLKQGKYKEAEILYKQVGQLTLKFTNFPNLHRIHVKAFEVEDCEFVPVHHQPKVISSNIDSASRAAMLLQ